MKKERKQITRSVLADLGKGDSVADLEVRGFQARRLPSGTITFTLRYTNAKGERRDMPLGLYGSVTIEQARSAAKKHTGAVADSRDPVMEIAAKRGQKDRTVEKIFGSLDDIGNDQPTFANLHLQGIDTGFEYNRCFQVYVKPRLGNMDIYEMRRSVVMKMLDEVAKENGETQSDRVLAVMRKFCNWYAVRDEDYSSPFVIGMARTKPKQRTRKRVLDDQEIRDLMTALDECIMEASVPRCFGQFVRALLYTGQRLRMVSNMSREEVDGNEWKVPFRRNKRKLTHLVYLTDSVLGFIKGNSDPFVFSSDGGEKSFKGFSKAKAALDAKLIDVRKRNDRKPMQHWVFHDLRRTARTLMSRVGVEKAIARRVLGQVEGGIDAVYDHYDYWKEKTDALVRLSIEIDRVLNPGKKVVAFQKRASR